MLKIPFILLLSLLNIKSAIADDALCGHIRINDTFVDDVTYKAGIDVRGKTVVPADLNDQSATITNIIKIPVTVDLAERFGVALPDGIKLEPELSVIEIHPNGQILMNGQDLTAETVALCSEKDVKTEAVSGQFPALEVLEPKATDDTEDEIEKDTEKKDDDIIWGESHLDY